MQFDFESVHVYFYIDLGKSSLSNKGKPFIWRASEASETLFSHAYGSSRYIYICTSVSNMHVHVECFAN